ncbi:hypothetical protein DVH24_006756 [Malus domestica]|uniref:Uncharacterized protein n=1 Tax=Malus domestica TaxID=3750 RepID=A0A498KBD4_MALDO|nr:hypothetical protein DVH24_006756 [Malus domestica]
MVSELGVDPYYHLLVGPYCHLMGGSPWLGGMMVGPFGSMSLSMCGSPTCDPLIGFHVRERLGFRLVENINLSWMLVGDFKELVNELKKSGG